MKIAEKVRKFTGLSPSKMSKAMGYKERASYAWFENHATKITLKQLGRLESIYTEHGGTAEAFAKLVRECR